MHVFRVCSVFQKRLKNGVNKDFYQFPAMLKEFELVKLDFGFSTEQLQDELALLFDLQD